MVQTIISKASISRIEILLCTYQGGLYLDEQMRSFKAQTHTNWHVWASDDASLDNTWAILERYRSEWNGRLSLFTGPRKGFVANFLSLIRCAEIRGDYYALSDQDDIWDSDKLERAIHFLETVPENIPALYCSRTRLVNENNEEIGLSPLFLKTPAFENALVQNIAGGNTMVFNNSARELICLVNEDTPVVIHDWMIYLIVSGCGGQILYDPIPSLRYRQHNHNLIGANNNLFSIITRLRMGFQGRFRHWNDCNIQMLQALKDRLAPNNCETLDRFISAREMSFFPRLSNFSSCGIYAQTLLGNLRLIVAAMFNKI